MRALAFRALAGLVQGFFFVLGERAGLLVMNAWHDRKARQHPFPGSGEPLAYDDMTPPYYKIWPHG